MEIIDKSFSIHIERIAKNLFLLIVSISVALVFVEAIFYFVPSLREKYAFKNFIPKGHYAEEMLNSDFSHWRPSKLVGFERVPNCASNVNSMGLIGEEFSINKDENKFRILVLGDSIIAENHLIGYLKKMLNNSGSEIKFEVINAGVPGYDIWQNANFLKYRGIELTPDMVIVSFCLGSFSKRDLVFYKTKRKFIVFTVPASRLLELMPINISLFRKSYVYRFFILTLEKMLSHGEQCDRRYTGIYYVGLIKEICNNHCIPFFGFIWPYLIPKEEYESWMEDQYSIILEVLDYLKIDYVDLHSHFPNKGIKYLRSSEYDYVHPSRVGHKIAAEVIFRHLVNNYCKW